MPARSVGEWRPPSENESGVMFKMAMTWVRRLGSDGFNGSKKGHSGVVTTGLVFGGGRELR